MGNCIIRQNMIMQRYQEDSEHKEPMIVHPVVQMYYPVPLPELSMEFNKNPQVEAESEVGNGVVRIKVVITKHELEMMLKKGGVSVGDLVSHMKKESSNDAVVIEDDDNRYCGKWKPSLDSIPELH